MLTVAGARLAKGFLNRGLQLKVAADVRDTLQAAPAFHPLTPWGKPMRVAMSSAGKYGWFSDTRGYRYIESHPKGFSWPPIPKTVLEVWRELVSAQRLPDCCLINVYTADAKLGLHQDKDEADFGWPVLSISLGDTATFRIGGTSRSDKTQSFALESGDVVLLEGSSRLAFHGIDRIRAGTSTLLPDGGRINLTLRVVDA